MEDQTRRPAGRPRDPGIRARVLLAAQRVYIRSGMAGFTFEAIARESAVGKPAIYRRWPSTTELMDDILSSHELVPEDSSGGGIRAELIEIAMRTLQLVHSEQGAFILRLNAEQYVQPGLFDQYLDRLRNVIHFQNRALVTESIQSGELAADCDPDVLIQSVTGAVFVSAILGFTVAPDADSDGAEQYCTRLVDQVLNGALPGVQNSRD